MENIQPKKSNARQHIIKVRMSNEEREKLIFISEVWSKTSSETIRALIDGEYRLALYWRDFLGLPLKEFRPI